MRGLTRDLLKKISDELGTNTARGHEISKDFALESPQVADRRADLGKKLERLESAEAAFSDWCLISRDFHREVPS